MQPPIPDHFKKALGGISPGYIGAFTQAAHQMVREGILGPDNPSATRILLNLLVEAAEDRRLEHFLGILFKSMTPKNRWLFRYPQLFQSWSDLAVDMVRVKPYMGVRYVGLWASGGFGETPPQVRLALRKARDLLKIDAGLSLNFLIGYTKLRRHLDADAIDRFIDKALHRYAYHPDQSYAFLQVRTKAAEAHIDRFSRKAGVALHRQRLAVIMQAISGAAFQIEVNPEWPIDQEGPALQPPLIHAHTVYLPAQFSQFETRAHNFDHLQFAVVVCAVAYAHNSFCRVHGQRGLATSRLQFQGRFAANATLLNNLFICTEVYRVLTQVVATFKGLGPVLARVLKDEQANRRDRGHDLLLDIIDHFMESGGITQVVRPGKQTAGHQKHPKLLALVQELALSATSYSDVVDLLTAPDAQTRLPTSETPTVPLQPLSFFPDYNHHLASGISKDALPDQEPKSPRQERSTQSSGQGMHEVMDSGEQNPEAAGGTETVQGEDRRAERKNKSKAPGNQFYYYDEWDQTNVDYHPHWVRLQEIIPAPVRHPVILTGERLRYVQKIKRAFEQLKPDLMRKQKFLLEGDEINTDLLIEHLCNRRAGLSTPANYYQKPYINRRDLAVALLLDLSGSTGSQLDNGRQVLDMEKEAAFILGEGLTELGDRFGIFGFTGQGRLGAEYFCFKSFDDPWNDRTQRALFGAAIGSTTRMGVAIRHTGYKLAKLAAHKKLVLVITDGKPMDAEYSPHDGYAQFDVAKAVGELKQRAIDVFCISTEENKIGDLELMFPFQRHAIIKSMTDLPELLTRFYLKLTA